jgi:hypothetical protein
MAERLGSGLKTMANQGVCSIVLLSAVGDAIFFSGYGAEGEDSVETTEG